MEIAPIAVGALMGGGIGITFTNWAGDRLDSGRHRAFPKVLILVMDGTTLMVRTILEDKQARDGGYTREDVARWLGGALNIEFTWEYVKNSSSRTWEIFGTRELLGKREGA